MLVLARHTVKKIEAPVRLSDYAVGIFEQLPSRKSVKKAIKKGAIYINNNPSDSGHWMQIGDIIELIDIEEAPKVFFDLKLEVVFEDEFLAVINKPSGIPVSGNQFKTIKNALPQNITSSTLPDALKFPKPVHRLDAQTSGLLIIAKTAKTHIALGKMFEEKTISKTYTAIVVGKPDMSGVIESSIENKQSTTYFRTIKTVLSLQNGTVSLMKFTPKTGRTHQIRIHTAEQGHPIIGDKLYGIAGKILKHKGLFLAATGLQFEHPVSEKNLTIRIDMPFKFQSYLEREARRWKKFND